MSPRRRCGPRPCAPAGSRGCRAWRPGPTAHARRRRGRLGRRDRRRVSPVSEPGPRTASADGLAYRMWPPSSTIRMTSWAFCTSVRKYASLLRRVTSWLNVTRSTASAVCEASTSRAPRRVNRTGSAAATTRSPTDDPAVGRSAGTSGHTNAVAKPSISRAATPSRSATFRSRLVSSGTSAPGPGTPAVAPSTSNTARCVAPGGTRKLDRSAHGCGQVSGVAGRHQVRPGGAQGALTLDGLPVSDDHSGQAHQDDQEQQDGRRCDHRRAPNVAGERLGEERAGRDERHRHQQCDASDAHLRRRRPHRAREVGHRRAQRRQAPGDVEHHPAEVVVASDRPGAVELPEAVDDVRRQEPGYAGAEQGRRTVAPARDEQAGESRHQEDVAERVGDRRRAFLPREPGGPGRTGR